MTHRNDVIRYRTDRRGAVLKSVQLDTSPNDGGLNVHSYFTAGASMAWDVARSELGVVLSRTMAKSSDGLNHQGAIAVTFDASTLEVVTNYGQTSGQYT